MTLTPDMQARKEALMRGRKPVPSPELCSIHGRVATMKDALEHSWCALCWKRCALVNWAHTRNWPAVYLFPYSIIDDRECWELNTLLAKDECIDVIYAGTVGDNSDTDDVEASA